MPRINNTSASDLGTSFCFVLFFNISQVIPNVQLGLRITGIDSGCNL